MTKAKISSGIHHDNLDVNHERMDIFIFNCFFGMFDLSEYVHCVCIRKYAYIHCLA